MLGTLRLALAAMVVASHVGGNVGSLNNGVIAVTMFYMISGYAITGLLSARFPESKHALIFYRERIIRLAPQYYVLLALTIIFTFGFHWVLTQEDTSTFFPHDLFAYISIVPLGFYRYLKNVHTSLIPQALTLGIEISFYIFSPWMLKSRVWSWSAALVSLGIFMAAALQVLPGNEYTYWTTPGPLCFYIAGSFLYKNDWMSLGLLTTAICSILGYDALTNYTPGMFTREFALGLIIGLPTLMFLTRLKPNRLDTELGNASYGCYLGQGFAFLALKYIFHINGVSEYTWFLRIIAVLSSCLLGYVSYYIFERPTIPYRRSLRVESLHQVRGL